MNDSILFRPLGEDGDVEIRATGTGRLLSGIAVPWNRPARIDSTLTESFRSGAFDRQVRSPGRIPLAGGAHFRDGGKPVGRVTLLRNDAKGLYFEAPVSAVAAGDEVLQLLNDGVFEHVSVGFRAQQDARGANGVLERVTATMTELAVILQGAYGDHAKVLAVRSACPTCGYQDAEPEHERSNVEAASLVIAGLRPLPAVSR